MLLAVTGARKYGCGQLSYPGAAASICEFPGIIVLFLLSLTVSRLNVANKGHTTLCILLLVKMKTIQSNQKFGGTGDETYKQIWGLSVDCISYGRNQKH